MRRLGAAVLGAALIAGAEPNLNAQAPEMAGLRMAGALAAASAPEALVETFQTGLIEALRASDGKGFAARRDKMKPVITKAFDTSYMVKVASGTYWSAMTPDQQKTLSIAFRDLTVANYAARFKNYKGQSFAITESKPLGQRTLVKSKLTRQDGDPVNLNYVVQPLQGGGVGIVDVHLGGGISELALRRSEFDPVLRDKGYAGLIALLQDKTKEIAAEASPGQ